MKKINLLLFIFIVLLSSCKNELLNKTESVSVSLFCTLPASASKKIAPYSEDLTAMVKTLTFVLEERDTSDNLIRVLADDLTYSDTLNCLVVGDAAEAASIIIDCGQYNFVLTGYEKDEEDNLTPILQGSKQETVTAETSSLSIALSSLPEVSGTLEITLEYYEGDSFKSIYFETTTVGDETYTIDNPVLIYQRDGLVIGDQLTDFELAISEPVNASPEDESCTTYLVTYTLSLPAGDYYFGGINLYYNGYPLQTQQNPEPLTIAYNNTSYKIIDIESEICTIELILNGGNLDTVEYAPFYEDRGKYYSLAYLNSSDNSRTGYLPIPAYPKAEDGSEQKYFAGWYYDEACTDKANMEIGDGNNVMWWSDSCEINIPTSKIQSSYKIYAKWNDPYDIVINFNASVEAPVATALTKEANYNDFISTNINTDENGNSYYTDFLSKYGDDGEISYQCILDNENYTITIKNVIDACYLQPVNRYSQYYNKYYDYWYDSAESELEVIEMPELSGEVKGVLINSDHSMNGGQYVVYRTIEPSSFNIYYYYYNYNESTYNKVNCGETSYVYGDAVALSQFNDLNLQDEALKYYHITGWTTNSTSASSYFNGQASSEYVVGQLVNDLNVFNSYVDLYAVCTPNDTVYLTAFHEGIAIDPSAYSLENPLEIMKGDKLTFSATLKDFNNQIIYDDEGNQVTYDYFYPSASYTCMLSTDSTATSESETLTVDNLLTEGVTVNQEFKEVALSDSTETADVLCFTFTGEANRAIADTSGSVDFFTSNLNVTPITLYVKYKESGISIITPEASESDLYINAEIASTGEGCGFNIFTAISQSGKTYQKYEWYVAGELLEPDGNFAIAEDNYLKLFNVTYAGQSVEVRAYTSDTDYDSVLISSY